MISTAHYPYPVNDKSSTRRTLLQPHIYSPSESHSSPRTVMYPHLHAAGCHSPSYVYPGYEQYYSKDSWPGAMPSSWPAYYTFPHRPSSSSLSAESAVIPKVTVLPPQPILVSDLDTPSSVSSHSVLTPSSPFAQHDMGDVDFQEMEFDEFEEEEEDYMDSDFADEMEGIDEAPSPLYGASAPQVIKSTSALAGALGDTPSSSSSYDSDLGTSGPTDRKLSASVPGYATASYRSTVPPSSSHQRWSGGEKAHSPAPLTSSPHESYPSSHTFTQRNYTTSPSVYDHAISSSSSLAGAFASSAPTSRHAHAHAHAPNRLPILQPQPIRPIPPIPIADLASSADEREACGSRSQSPEPLTDAETQTTTATTATTIRRLLSPLPLLCQPVSDAVRYQLKEPSATMRSGGNNDDHDNDGQKACYDLENNDAPTTDLITDSEENDDRRSEEMQMESMYPHPHPHHHHHHHHQHHHHHLLHQSSSAGGAYSMVEKLYSSCVSMGSPIRWQ